MTHKLLIKLSSVAASQLTALSKRFKMSQGEALSWVLVETAPPVVPKRGKTTRETSMDILISDQAQAVLTRVVATNESSESVVVEAYLGREYR